MTFHINLVDWLPGIASGLLVLSYALRNIKWLRLLVLGASVIDIVVYYVTHPGQPMWIPVGKQILIMGINVYQLFVLYKEARPINFSTEAASLYRQTFAVLTPGEFQKVLRVGSFETLSPGSQLTQKDTPVEAVYVLLSGELDVTLGGVTLATMTQSGTLVGEMGYITRTNASADVRVALECRVFRMPVNRIERLRRKRTDLHVKLIGILSGGIAEKLRRSDERLVSHLQEQPGSG